MSQYLRDEFLKNLSLSEDALRKINDEIVSIRSQVNVDLDMKSKDDKIMLLQYIIRFDNKGFRLFDFEPAIKHFQDAHRVERFIFILESKDNIRTSKLQGKNLELSFDSQNSAGCRLTVQDDDMAWVDFVFCKMKERLSKYKNYNFLIQNRYVPVVVQLLGVIFGLMVSFWIANKLSPRLTIQNALAFTFLIAFLLFSNTWGLLYDGILRSLNYFWPNISFKARGGLHWLIKASISSSFVGLSFFTLNRLFGYMNEILKSLIK